MLVFFFYVLPAYFVGTVKHHSQTRVLVEGLKLFQVCLVQGFDDPYLTAGVIRSYSGDGSPGILVLKLNPLFWDWVMRMCANC